MKQLSQDQVDEIRENFDHFDSDKNGRIYFAEYSKLLVAGVCQL